MIEASGITKIYNGNIAVDHISFAAGQGENIALLGTSGCGKTTTLRMLNRLVEPDEGEIKINGKDIRSIPVADLRRNIGYVLQFNGLFPHYTVEQNIGIVPGLLKWDKKKTKTRTLELLEQLHLPEKYLALYPAGLSGGEQQRVGVARALAADPEVLLMDEPFGALDAVTRGNITRDFLQLKALQNKTIVLVTHDIQEAFTLGDKVILMHQGKIMQTGTPTELLFNPANDFVQHFFEDDRLKLELIALKLKDIFPLLTDVANEGAIFLDDDKNLWETVQNMNENSENNYGISKSEVTIKLDYSIIFEALEKFKTRKV